VGGGHGSCGVKTYFIEKDQDRTLYRYIPIMTTTCKGSMAALLSARFRECINICINQIVMPDNTSLGDDLVDKTTVLRINKNFMKFMNLDYPWMLKQRFPTFGTVISVADNKKTMSRWTGNRYIHVPMYSLHTIYA